VDVAEREGGALAWRKAGEERQRAVEVGVVARRRGPQRRPRLLGGPAPAGPAGLAQRRADGDPVDPRVERAGIAQGAAAQDDLQRDLLGEVGGGLAVAEHAEGRPPRDGQRPLRELVAARCGGGHGRRSRGQRRHDAGRSGQRLMPS
jgi:hypothetical protein